MLSLVIKLNNLIFMKSKDFIIAPSDKLNGYIKYLQDYIQGISSEDYDPEDYLSFDKWLRNN